MKASLFMRKLFTRALPNLHHLAGSKVRRCRCCREISLIVSFSRGEEFKFCIRCKANLRYELLADAIRSAFPQLENLRVLELDSSSPLQAILESAKEYYRSFYSNDCALGTVTEQGARCEDITKLTFEAESLDLIISSDVLEHVPDLQAAFAECIRVLRPGGCHLFTVPTRYKTQKRAEVRDGGVEFLTEPEYHSDPLNARGILAYWDFGLDAAEIFSSADLEIRTMAEPVGKDQRVVWCARKPKREG